MLSGLKMAFQVIKTTDSKVFSETLGDTVRVSQLNVWEITWNIQTGSIESWKVSVAFMNCPQYHI